MKRGLVYFSAVVDDGGAVYRHFAALGSPPVGTVGNFIAAKFATRLGGGVFVSRADGDIDASAGRVGYGEGSIEFAHGGSDVPDGVAHEIGAVHFIVAGLGDEIEGELLARGDVEREDFFVCGEVDNGDGFGAGFGGVIGTRPAGVGHPAAGGSMAAGGEGEGGEDGVEEVFLIHD